LRHQRRHLLDAPAHGGGALADARGELRALALARRHQLVQRSLAQPLGDHAQRFFVALGLGDHAGPPQHVCHAQRRRVRKGLLRFGRQAP